MALDVVVAPGADTDDRARRRRPRLHRPRARARRRRSHRQGGRRAARPGRRYRHRGGYRRALRNGPGARPGGERRRFPRRCCRRRRTRRRGRDGSRRAARCCRAGSTRRRPGRRSRRPACDRPPRRGPSRRNRRCRWRRDWPMTRTPSRGRREHLQVPYRHARCHDESGTVGEARHQVARHPSFEGLGPRVEPGVDDVPGLFLGLRPPRHPRVVTARHPPCDRIEQGIGGDLRGRCPSPDDGSDQERSGSTMTVGVEPIHPMACLEVSGAPMRTTISGESRSLHGVDPRQGVIGGDGRRAGACP